MQRLRHLHQNIGRDIENSLRREAIRSDAAIIELFNGLGFYLTNAQLASHGFGGLLVVTGEL